MQETKAKAKAEAAKKTAKQSNKQLIKLDQKRFTFDPKNIAKAVQNALDNEFSDYDEGQKELLVVNKQNLREALHAGYSAAAKSGNRVESGFFLGYRRIFSVAHEARTAAECGPEDFADYDLSTINGQSSSSAPSIVEASTGLAGGIDADAQVDISCHILKFDVNLCA